METAAKLWGTGKQANTPNRVGRLARDLRFKLRRGWNHASGRLRLRLWLACGLPLRFVIGASGWGNEGWFATDEQFLDLTKRDHWSKFFQTSSIEALLAEHVLEHLTPDEARTAVAITYDYLKPGGYFRVAVPDGNHPDPVYQEWVRVGGREPWQTSNDHKVFYTYQSLGELFNSVGFEVRLYEYFDERSQFHQVPWDTRKGMIRRSRDHDKRNTKGLVYTSIILDAVKPHG